MARRPRRSRRRTRLTWLIPLGLLAVLAVGWLLVRTVRLAADHPVVTASVIVLCVAVVGVPVWTVVRDRVRAAEESRRRTEAAVAEAAVRQADLDRQVSSTSTMTGPQFEQLIARLLERDGCEDVRVCGGAGDRGADVTAIDPRGWRVVVQCKRYGPRNPVRDPDIQRFLGTVWDEHRAEIALFVTTSSFTRAARELGTRRRVVLVDGRRLAGWMSDGPTASPLPADPLEEVG